MERRATENWALKMKVPLEPGIVCQDIERMIAFYTDVIGLKLVADARTLPELSRKLGGAPCGYRIVRLQTPYGERIKFVQPDEGAPQPNPVPQWVFQRHGLAYLTFVIEGLPQMLERLKAHGVKFVTSAPVEVRPGVFALYVLDPEGNYVEFVEYPDIASYRPDLFQGG
jgi:catechol 2,3-dioxygenase-like lactoylglutathione lyase family enzyme